MRFAIVSILLFLLGTAAAAADPIDYRTQVKPILQARCYACHGALAQKAKLRVDSGAGMLQREVIVPGRPGDSPLLKRISADDDADRMPPEGHPLKPEEIARIRDWIAQGTKVPADDASEPDPRDHWSFRPPARPVPPAAGQPGTITGQPFAVRNPIDAFVAAKWREHDLKPVAAADKRVLLRRIYLDLIGLPPTPGEIEAYLADSSPDAYERVVDKLLASPQYGEHWGRHFLDIWRYSDWWGLGAELRNSQRHIWHWRDWVIESFNADLGYDEMVRQMLAADELYPTDSQKLPATGYLARSYFLFNRTSWLDEVVEHTGKSFLGLTFNCAKCHDHKYDPIRQLDYYRFRAIFEPYQVRTDLVSGELDAMKDGIPRAFDCNLDAKTPFHIRGDERNPDPLRTITPGLPLFLAPDGLKIQLVKLPPFACRPGMRPEIVEGYRQAAIAKVAAAKEGLSIARARLKATPIIPELASALAPSAERGLTAAEAELEAIEARARADRSSSKDDARTAARAVKLLAVLNAELSLTKAEAEVLSTAPAAKPTAETKRKAASEALFAARKAAEVVGETYTPLPGAVKSAESNLETAESRNRPFPDTSSGRRTALARWLTSRDNPLTARVAANHVWMRHFGRPLVANVFEFGRKGSSPSHPELLDWLAVELMDHNWSIKHLHRVIVTSNLYRLSSSAANANENVSRDPENRFLWRMNSIRMEAQAVRDSLLHLAGNLDLTIGGPPVPLAEQEASRRRSLYFFHSHNEHNKMLDVFDNANVLECYRRTESIVPQQALALWNSRLALSACGKINESLHGRLGTANDETFVSSAFEMILGTTPSEDERTACLESLDALRAALKDLKEPERTKRARLQVIQALVNHNDFVTVR